MIEVNIGWKGDTQKKVFEDRYKAMEWIKKNYENVTHINFNDVQVHRFFEHKLSDFELMAMIENKFE